VGLAVLSCFDGPDAGFVMVFQVLLGGVVVLRMLGLLHCSPMRQMMCAIADSSCEQDLERQVFPQAVSAEGAMGGELELSSVGEYRSAS
jgi:hypothetical protein